LYHRGSEVDAAARRGTVCPNLDTLLAPCQYLLDGNDFGCRQLRIETDSFLVATDIDGECAEIAQITGQEIGLRGVEI